MNCTLIFLLHPQPFSSLPPPSHQPLLAPARYDASRPTWAGIAQTPSNTQAGQATCQDSPSFSILILTAINLPPARTTHAPIAATGPATQAWPNRCTQALLHAVLNETDPIRAQNLRTGNPYPSPIHLTSVAVAHSLDLKRSFVSREAIRAALRLAAKTNSQYLPPYVIDPYVGRWASIFVPFAALPCPLATLATVRSVLPDLQVTTLSLPENAFELPERAAKGVRHFLLQDSDRLLNLSTRTSVLRHFAKLPPKRYKAMRLKLPIHHPPSNPPPSTLPVPRPTASSTPDCTTPSITARFPLQKRRRNSRTRPGPKSATDAAASKPRAQVH